MANKTPDQLASAPSAGDTDLLLIYPSGGPLKKLAFSAFLAQVLAGLSGTLLSAAANLSDLASASSARANLGLGTAATLASSALFQVANNLSEVAHAATARANLGAAASASPSFTGGMTVSGATKLTPLAMGAMAIDWSAQDVQTKSLSSSASFTFSNLTTGKAQGMVLGLSLSGGAVPGWPAGTKFGNDGADFSELLGNGDHLLGLVTLDGVAVIVTLIERNVAVPA